MGGFLRTHVTGADLATLSGFLLFAVLFALILKRASSGYKFRSKGREDRGVPQARPKEVEQPPTVSGQPQPDFSLGDLTKRVTALSSEERDEQGAILTRPVSLEIADKIWWHELTVWGRFADFPLKPIEPDRLEHVMVDVANGVIRIPDGRSFLTYTEVQFVKAEIDKVWPAPTPSD